MPCENMQRTQEYSPCLCLYRALYAVFVIPADGNRQEAGVSQAQERLCWQPGHSELSLRALVSAVLDGDQVQSRGFVCI